MGTLTRRVVPSLAAAVNLNHEPRFVHWGFFQMSVANVAVIALMIVVFVLAILLPFRSHRDKR